MTISISNSRSLERPVLIIETLEYCGARGHGLFLIPIHYGFLFYHFPTFKVFILPTLHQVVVVYIVVFVPSPLQPLQNLSRLSHGSCSREGSSIVRHFIQTGAFLRVLFPQLHIFWQAPLDLVATVHSDRFYKISGHYVIRKKNWGQPKLQFMI